MLTRTGLASVALAAVVAVSLTGCSGSSSDEDPSSDGSATSSQGSDTEDAAPYLPVPDGVELTPQGSELEVPGAAVVAYEPRQGTVGVLDLDVTKLEKTTIKESFGAWVLKDAQKKSTPYFVTVKVENVGDTDLGDQEVPLYVVNDQNVLLESTPFASNFTACPSTALPKKFGPGKKATMCLVYLAPDKGSLEAVSFRPEETFDPITWTGKVTTYQKPKPEKKDDKKKS